MKLADVHAHLTHPETRSMVSELLENALHVGVSTVISNGLNPADNQQVLEMAERFPMVKPALGLYPVEITGSDRGEAKTEDAAAAGVAWLEENVQRSFAVGEIGLDGRWTPEELWPRQEETFNRLVRLAMRADKPIIVHSRKRERRAFEIVDELGASRVLWHCFGGKLNLAREIAERGHYFSIPANARRSEGFTRMLVNLPRERILFETDCPYLSPDRERASQPSDVAQTAAYAAELWGTSAHQVADQLAFNFKSLFGVEP